jgi:hypothetical protein
MLKSAFNVITNLEEWQYIKNNPPGVNGYSFSNDEKIKFIMNKINEDYPGHSGSSIAITMRIMQEIANKL